MKKVKKIKATITLETTFESYGDSEMDERACRQIECWIKETLECDDTIPLFVRSHAGEETGEKVIDIKTTMK